MENVSNKDLVEKLKLEGVLLDTLPNPVYYKDKEGKFVRCNECFCKLVQKDKKDLIGKLAYSLFSKVTSDRHKKIDAHIIETLGTNTDEIIYTSPDGVTRYITLNKAVYLKSDGSIGGIVCVMYDTTEQMKQKELLIQQSKFAEMGETVASIAHQWNEPLVELSAIVQEVEINYSIDNIDKNIIKSYVNDSMEQIKYMSNTLSDFRNFLKPSIKKEVFDIKKAFREIFAIVGRQIFYYDIDVSFDYGCGKGPLLVYAYENELKQVLLNIINNAKNKIIKITEDEECEFNISIKVIKEDDFTYIQIIDNAGKINEDIITKVFQPFFTTKANGTGFGLYMAKLIIEDKMNGKLSVWNDDNNVVFEIKLPNKKQT
ncbi:PAS domain-containing protein [Arcobacter sp. HD9-500m-PIT-SAG03]|nr:PAS domain-containing protein [Arcobacter sp. HD9-500m-PIT-SAG03]